MNYKLYFVPLPPVAQTISPPPQPEAEASSRSSKFEVLEFELLVKLIKLTVNKPIKNKPFSFILNNFKILPTIIFGYRFGIFSPHLNEKVEINIISKLLSFYNIIDCIYHMFYAVKPRLT